MAEYTLSDRGLCSESENTRVTSCSLLSLAAGRAREGEEGRALGERSQGSALGKERKNCLFVVGESCGAKRTHALLPD